MSDRLHLRLLNIPVWPILAVILSLATMSHDVGMASHSHQPHRSSLSAEITPAQASAPPHHGHAPASAHEVHGMPADTCPPAQCPALVDCGVARVIAPITSPPITHEVATLCAVPQVLTPPASAALHGHYSHPPPDSAAIRRARLQVFRI